MTTSIIARATAPLLLFSMLLLSGCDSDPVQEIEDDVLESPGTFAASVEGSAPAKLSGRAVYGVTTDPQTGAESLWIVFYRPNSSKQHAVVMTSAGSNLPALGEHRIAQAPVGGVTAKSDGGILAYYTPTPPSNLHRSRSGAVTIVSHENGVLKGKFHFASDCDTESTFASLLGAFAALPADGEIRSLINLP